MYLDHFGFAEQPFSCPSIPDLFFEGASRGAILDSLIYTLTHGEGEEGIIKVTGSSGSGKTWICRLTMSQLPRHMHTAYFSNPNISKEEFVRSLVNTLNLELAGDPGATEPPAYSMEQLSEALIGKYAPGRQIELLIDEAHTASPEALEELRLLYDLVSPHDKLLQIVLFGEAALDKLLASPQLRMFKSRITHHFFLQPITARSLKDYLLHRLHAAGYHGPDIFTQPAVRLIAGASSGLIDHINILADKSLLAAFRENTKNVVARHVRSAIQDSGFKPHSDRSVPANYIVGGSAAAVAVAVAFAIGGLVRQPSDSSSRNNISGNAPVSSSVSSSMPPVAATPTYNTVPATTPAIATSPALPPAKPQPSLSPKDGASAMPGAPAVPDVPSGNNLAVTTGQKRSGKSAVAGVKLADYPLLHERVDATAKMLGATDKQYLTLQLFSTDNVQPDRMERFLSRAQSLVNLTDLYVYPVTTGGQAKFRVAYGIYLTRRQADAAMSDLPQKYQDAFHPEVYTLGELQ